MIGKIRLVFVLACALPAYLLFLPLQVLAMKTGWYGENVFRSLLHRVNLWALGIRVHRVGAMTDRRPLLVVANHVSWTDISVLGSFLDVSFVAKSQVATWPVVGWLSTLQRCVYIERERRRKSGEQASEIAGRLAARHAMVLFAEGSTGDGNFLLPFKSTLFGAATMAIGQGAAETVHVQPVAIVYTRLHGVPMGRLHRPHAAWIGEQELATDLFSRIREGGMDVEVHFGEPIALTSGAGRKQVARAAEKQVHDMMQAALRAPRPSA